MEGWQADDGTLRLSYESNTRSNLLYALDDNGDMAAPRSHA